VKLVPHFTAPASRDRRALWLAGRLVPRSLAAGVQDRGRARPLALSFPLQWRFVAGRGTTATIALDRAKIPFTLHEYEHDPRSGSYGLEASEALGVPPERVFKTLVAAVDGGTLAVGVVPVHRQLDLKALAAAVGGKKAVMAEVAAAERATGYVAGGISPVGQKKRLPVVIDSSALELPTLFCSAGRRGLEIELTPADLMRAVNARLAPIAAG
jgi:Cys-tRNA(Pro)/Cys-tRNA(Cys) deacylase